MVLLSLVVLPVLLLAEGVLLLTWALCFHAKALQLEEERLWVGHPLVLLVMMLMLVWTQEEAQVALEHLLHQERIY